MTPANSLSEIVTRINQGQLTEADLTVLSDVIGNAVAQGDRAVAITGDAQAATITTGDGNVVLNILFQADGLRIAGQSVQGQVVETLRQLLQGSLCPIAIDWQQVSRSLLDEQIQRLTTNPLTRAEGIAYQTQQVYVPLGLVERKRQSRRREDVSPEQGSLLYEETEITQKFEHEAFLEEVLRLGRSPRSGGRRIAVIGEPGAGKTTLLQQVARWVSENIEGAIAIWVSLADLQGRSLEDYLLEQWLQAVVQQQGRADASTQVKDAFVAQVQQGRVWLLLDGVDEMAVSSGNPLSEMERQVRLGGLLGQMRLVLTCRVNLWDGDRHALDTFDTYRTLEFDYPGQVEQFVERWFEALPEAQVGQAEKLCVALRQPGKERMRDLVKNPLRLTLLCFNWYLGEGTLPETKAGLYEQFVADFYEWKRELFPTMGEQRRRLNAALGELAREAIDKEETRFRLRYDFVSGFLGEPDEPDSLFQMALRLGWLNQIGVDTENRRKAVYAFFHPTFQEYFAALAISDWHYFLNHFPEEPSNQDARYRIFEPHWEEIIFLWFGRPSIKKESKESLIEALIGFEDRCEEFYWHQAYFLTAQCLTEFVDSKYANEIVNQLIDWGVGLYTTFLDPINENARAVLRNTNRSVLITILANLLDTDLNESELLQIAIRLGEIDPGNLDAIRFLIKLINMQEIDEHDRWVAIYQLGNVGTASSNPEAIYVLTGLLNTTKDDEILWRAATSLGEIDPHNLLAIKVLVCLSQSNKNDSIRLSAARNLIQVSPSQLISKETLTDLACNTQDREICSLAIFYLKEFWENIPEASDSLYELLEQNENQNFISFVQDEQDENCSEELLEEDDWIRGEIEPADLDSVNLLINFMCNSSSRDTIFSAAWSLREINDETLFPQVVMGLRNCFKDLLIEDNLERYRCCYAVVWYCSQNMAYPTFYNAWNT